ncbi:IDEAL domain-containing protein [Ammoniphilus sp. 3BR4]|uniref:IDEAL domain-containing protein n=1 Tax=Ammoniphilus sp. 3BR4 TaxID=3158265 RepID=UPI003467B533
MNHLQYGDEVIVCNEDSNYNSQMGTVFSIDIYGHVKVRMQEDEMVVKFQREELKLIFKRYNTTHYMDQNPSFIKYLQYKYQTRSNHTDQLLRMEQLKQLIDIALDSRDQAWFENLSRQLKAISRIRD